MDRKEEILSVIMLGEKIGYGNMMDIASAIWGIKLRKQGFSSGEFLITIPQFIVEDERDRANEEHDMRIEEVKKVLGEII